MSSEKSIKNWPVDSDPLGPPPLTPGPTATTFPHIYDPPQPVQPSDNTLYAKKPANTTTGTKKSESST
ncbi:hypothetical protein CVT24_007672 [Panaeolus cyanescens]|uniref:Uncharacterized protein n=1 Tax=Panaeolus cyanescens TaxID=181874 RepID=A0A409W9R1_9AGAR|nr:hypothetical protein CVT24_007672 [Panaeolus cyanescens]